MSNNLALTFVRPRRIIMIAMLNCFLAALFCVYEFILRVLPSPMVSQLMKKLHTDAQGIGILSAAFFITYSLMQIPVGLLYDTFSVRILLTISTTLCAIGSIIFSQVHFLWIAIASRAITGLGASFAIIGTFLLISRWFPAKYFSFITGLVQLMCAAGAILGQAPIADLMHTKMLWNNIIFFTGLTGFALAAIYFFLIRDHPPTKYHTPHRPQLKKTYLYFIDIATQFHNWLIAAYACFTWGPVSVLAALWGIPFLAATYHVGFPLAANAIAFVWVGIAIGSPIIGWLSYHYKNKWFFISTCPLLSFLVSFILIYFNQVTFQTMHVLLFLFGFSAGVLPLTFALIKQKNPKHMAGSAIGFNNMAVVLGGALFQPLVGNILKTSWQGYLENGTPYYTLSDYHHALFILPSSAILCFILALFMKKYFNFKQREPDSA